MKNTIFTVVALFALAFSSFAAADNPNDNYVFNRILEKLTSGTSGTIAATQSGTWTVQPGNTANTTAWLVTGTGGTFPVTGTFWQATQPVSAASLPLPTGAATNASLLDSITVLNAISTNTFAITDNTGSYLPSIGLPADAAVGSFTDPGTVIALEKGILEYLSGSLGTLKISGSLTDGNSDPAGESVLLIGGYDQTNNTISAFNLNNGTLQVDATGTISPQIGGVNASSDAGNSDVGTQRVILPYDQPAIPVNITGYTPVNIATATTTQVATGLAVLHSIVVNTKGTIASTITVYDDVAGTSNKICVIDSLNLSGTFEFDATCSNGIKVVTTGTVAPDITVMYR